MLTNFDLIWLRVRQLIDELMQADDPNISEDLFNTYCEAFNQLVQVVEDEPDGVTEEKLEIVHLYLLSLEEKYSETKKELQKRISEERLKASTFATYSQTNEKANYFNKKT
ncbi:MAG: hypothetical protein LBP51_02860 [Deferribacteraceae bacterium]|jgi:lipase chaperone LimK|nr:hypothetical protein [Deferribacteraceae bacterium]